MSRDTWVVKFRATPGGLPESARIKRLLKYAGRRCGLRCVAVRVDSGDEDDSKPKSASRADGSRFPRANDRQRGVRSDKANARN